MNNNIPMRMVSELNTKEIKKWEQAFVHHPLFLSCGYNAASLIDSLEL